MLHLGKSSLAPAARLGIEDVTGPDPANPFLVTHPFGGGRAGIVCAVPPPIVQRGAEHTAPGHFQVPIGIGFLHPIPGVL